MGSCVRKVDKGVTVPHVCEVLMDKVNEKRMKSSLLDLKKARCAPLLALGSNTRFNSRLSEYTRRQMSSGLGDTISSEAIQKSPTSL